MSQGESSSVLVVSCGELVAAFEAELGKAIELVVVETLSESMAEFRRASHDLVVCGLDEIGWQLTPLFRLAKSAQVPVLPVARSSDAFDSVDVAQWAVKRSHVGAVVDAARIFLAGEASTHAELEQLLPSSSLRVKAKKGKKGLIGRRSRESRVDSGDSSSDADTVTPSTPAGTAGAAGAPSSAPVEPRPQWPPSEPSVTKAAASERGRGAANELAAGAEELDERLAQTREQVSAELLQQREEQERGLADVHRRIDSVARALRDAMAEQEEQQRAQFEAALEQQRLEMESALERQRAQVDAAMERQGELREQLIALERFVAKLHEHHKAQIAAAQEREEELRARLEVTRSSLEELAQGARSAGVDQVELDALSRRVTKQLELSHSQHELLADELKATKSSHRARLGDLEHQLTELRQQQQETLRQLARGGAPGGRGAAEPGRATPSPASPSPSSSSAPSAASQQPLSDEQLPSEGDSAEELRKQLQSSLSRLAKEWAPKKSSDT